MTREELCTGFRYKKKPSIRFGKHVKQKLKHLGLAVGFCAAAKLVSIWLPEDSLFGAVVTVALYGAGMFRLFGILCVSEEIPSDHASGKDC